MSIIDDLLATLPLSSPLVGGRKGVLEGIFWGLWGILLDFYGGDVVEGGWSGTGGNGKGGSWPPDISCFSPAGEADKKGSLRQVAGFISGSVLSGPGSAAGGAAQRRR